MTSYCVWHNKQLYYWKRQNNSL